MDDIPVVFTLDREFWGVRLRKPWDIIVAPWWDFERVNALACQLSILCGVEVAESLFGVILPTVLRERENAEQVAAAPEAIRPELRMHRDGSRWADVRVALENRLPHLRQSFAQIIGALAAPSLLPHVLTGMQVAQGPEHAPMPLCDPRGKVLPGVFARPQDVWATVLAVTVENALPLDAGERTKRDSPTTSTGSLPLIRHWRAYRGQSSAEQSSSKAPPTP